MDEPIFNHTAHKELWDWLSKNPRKNKEEWPKWKENGGEIVDVLGVRCFACSIVQRYNDGGYKCKESCPLLWSRHSNNRSCGDEWFIWDSAKGLDGIRSSYAKTIRDLPVREGVKCI